MIIKQVSLITVGLIMASMAVAEDAASVGEAPWQFGFNVYLWRVDAPVTIKVNQQEVANLPEDFDTIIDALQMAFMGEFNVRKGPLSFFAAPIYYRGELDKHFRGPLGARRKAKIKEEVWLVDYGLSWEFGPWNLSKDAAYPTISVSPIAGARYLRDNIAVDVPPGILDMGLKVRTTLVFNTPFLGLKSKLRFSERWSLGVEYDHGVADADKIKETYNALGIVAYHYKIKQRSARWFAGYRFLKLDIENDPVSVDLEVKGPLIGFGMDF